MFAETECFSRKEHENRKISYNYVIITFLLQLPLSTVQLKPVK